MLMAVCSMVCRAALIEIGSVAWNAKAGDEAQACRLGNSWPAKGATLAT